MSEASSIEINVDQLLRLRHIPTPAARRTPESNAALIGAFASRQHGQGSDYDDLRLYSPGDDIRHIDWRASARTNTLHTRLYRAEKQHRSTIICDLRLCMFTGSKVLRANQAVMLSARLLWQACKGGTLTTLIIIAPEGLCTLPPGAGHTTAIRGCKLLATEHQRIARTLKMRLPSDAISVTDAPVTGTDDESSVYQLLPTSHKEHGPTLDSVLQWLIAHGEHKATLLWVSGFDYEGKLFYDSLGSIATNSINLALQIDDPLLDDTLPSGDYHYASESAVGSGGKPTKPTLYSARVNRINQVKLVAHLAQIRQIRAARFEALTIPYLTNAAGDDAIIAALRNQAYLA